MDSYGLKSCEQNDSHPVATPRAGRYDGIIVIPRYVNSSMLIPQLFLLYDFIVIERYHSDIANRSRKWRCGTLLRLLLFVE